MLANRDHLDVANRTRLHLMYERFDRWLVSVLEPHPDDTSVTFRSLQDAPALVDSCTQRLFDHHVHVVVSENVFHDVGVSEVGGHHHNCVTHTRCQQVTMIGEGHLVGYPSRFHPKPAGLRIRVRDCYDVRAVDGVHIVDVLEAHHPGADHAVANLFSQCCLLSRFRDSRRWRPLPRRRLPASPSQRALRRWSPEWSPTLGGC